MSTTGNPKEVVEPVQGNSNWRRWTAVLAVAVLAAWLCLNFTPVKVRIPEELVGVDMYSPPELQERLADVEPDVVWKNSLIKLGFVGLCLGGILGCFAVRKRRLAAAAVGIVSGVACGLVCGHFGLAARKYADSAESFALLGDIDPMLIDAALFASISVILSLPIALTCLMSAEPHGLTKAFSILLAGGVAGMLTPLATVLLPSAATHRFPPHGWALTALWLTLLGGLICLTIVRRAATKSSLSEKVAED